jgi:hypothetical protein
MIVQYKKYAFVNYLFLDIRNAFAVEKTRRFHQGSRRITPVGTYERKRGEDRQTPIGQITTCADLIRLSIYKMPLSLSLVCVNRQY